MAYFRKRLGKWQCVILIKGHPTTTKTFVVKKDAKFHDLRRQALTNFMKDKKLSVAETMYISGHSDPKMLLKTYNNLKLLDVSKRMNELGEST